MFNSTKMTLVSLLFAGLAAAGCEYHDCDDDHDPFCDEDDDKDESFDEADPAHACSKTCGRLVACGRVPSAGRAACESSCSAAYSSSDYGTRLFCRCAAQSSCGELVEECGPVPGTIIPPPPPPPPPPRLPTDNASPPPVSMPGSLDGGAPVCMAEAGTADAGCRSDGDCANVEACREGVCRARCEQTCDCRAGDVCAQGVCSPSATPVSCPSAG